MKIIKMIKVEGLYNVIREGTLMVLGRIIIFVARLFGVEI